MSDQTPPLEFGNVEPIELQTEMEQSFLVYALSVITSRALPDVRDGLKPVHRRILWDMFEQGFRPDRPHVKCARVTGDVMAKYHPHGNEAMVDFAPNYSGEFDEPVVLPARFPNLLVNGSQGIAVGMATNIPPHNLGEVIDAVLHVIDHPDATPDDLMQFITGPDFPTGGYILGRAGIMDAYRTGRGSIKMRAKA